MNKDELQTLLTARYNRENWKTLLLGVFHDNGAKVTFSTSPAPVERVSQVAEY
jgi:hypothetical protein